MGHVAARGLLASVLRDAIRFVRADTTPCQNAMQRRHSMDNARLPLYLGFALVLFLIWQAWQAEYGPKPLPQSEPSATAQQQVPTEDVPNAVSPVAQSADVVPRAEPSVGRGASIRVLTDVLDVLIDTRGGDLHKVELLNYPVSAGSAQPFTLLQDDKRLYVAQSGLVADATGSDSGAEAAPSHHALYSAERAEYRLAPGSDELVVPLTWQGNDGVSARKTFTFKRGEYLIRLAHEVTNGTASNWSGRAYHQLRHGPVRDEDKPRFIYTYTGGAYYDGKYHKLKFEDMGEDPLKAAIAGGWAAMLQHYFVSAWIPPSAQSSNYYTKTLPGNSQPEYLIGFSSPSQTLAPGKTARFDSSLFVGPKLQDVLEKTAPGLELTVDYGLFTVFSKPLFIALGWIHSMVGNWGWAIVILTALIKLAFYKFSEISYRSMARMRSMQPKMVALRERYAEDKQRMNQALMEMYRTEKINPLGGCLPILIQIPVFIALYWVLLESVELRQAPFILWIDDLSTKDPFFVLPVLMGVTMYIQQKLNPAPLDPMQAKIFMVMPFIFTGFFAFFPSGLVLYWFVNNLLSIAQQWVITKRVQQAASPVKAG
jgi:YidC/Oxa1 family membrane protein insertase